MKHKRCIKVLIFIAILGGGLLLIMPVFAISGACSWHGGVNCSAGPDWDGSVICNDGWKDSTVSFYSMIECLSTGSTEASCTLSEYKALEQKYGITEKWTELKSLDQEISTILDQIDKVENNNDLIPLTSQLNKITRKQELLLSQIELLKENLKLECKAMGIDKDRQQKISVLEELKKIEEQKLKTLSCPSNSNYISGNCYCREGYEWNIDGTFCVKSVACPLNSTKIGNICICNEGYVMRDDKCITYTEDCMKEYGSNVYGLKGNNNNSHCYCKSGYNWNLSQTTCIKIIENIEPITKLTKETELPKDQKRNGEEQIIKEDITVEENNSNKKNTDNNQQENEEAKKEKRNFGKSISMFLADIFSAIRNLFSKIF